MDHFRNVIVVLIVLVVLGSISTVKRCKQREPPKVVHIRQCGQLPYTSKGRFLLDVHEFATVNATARLKCNIGFQLFGNPTTRCMENLQWSFTFAICKEIVCKGVPQVDNGSFKVIGSSNVGGIAILICRPGHFLTNGPVVYIHCKPTGMWSAIKGTCEKASTPDCGDLPTAKDGRFELTKGNGKFGSVAIFKCLDGCSIPCDDTIACCGADGEWKVTGTATCPTTLVSAKSASFFFGTIDVGTTINDIIDTNINSCIEVSPSSSAATPVVQITMHSSVVINKVLIIGAVGTIDLVDTGVGACYPIMIENGQASYQCNTNPGSSTMGITGTTGVNLQLCEVKIFISQPCESK